MSFFSNLFGDPNDRFIKSLQPIVDQINSLEETMKEYSDDELRALTGEFRERLNKEETLDDILPEAFAAVREAARRTLGQRHYDVQLIGGITLHQGTIAEMRTGEGKTLVATLPVYLNALTGKGVHLVTVNDYLSRRDAAWMGQVYHALGLTSGCLNHDTAFVYDPEHKPEDSAEDEERDATGSFRVAHEFLRPVQRRQAYEADITYGTNNEFGFDYLRDNMVYQVEQMAQRPANTHHFAIVDEVDSILIDEARTPLIISAPDEESGKLYEEFARAVPSLVEEDDYTIDEKRRAASITDSGIEKIQKRLGLGDIYQEGGTKHVHHLEQALRAQVLFKRDKDYVVKEGQVVIVDEHTGRLMPGRRWSDGLHQAVEAKEGVSIQRESRTLATVTFQNYFRLYKKLAGMTGTAKTSAEEFHKVYGLNTIVVPTHKPLRRNDMPDRIYKTKAGKMRAVVEHIKERTEAGQPILVGTASIQQNEVMSVFLKQAGVEHNMLNAKNHEREAEILAQAGRLGAVTVATNMAGRGVDIILGGNPASAEDAEKVRELGGLLVLGTERHEARRTDDQLRGRAGRQGDAGASQFYVSTEDDLVRVFGGDRLKSIMDTLGVAEDEAIENRLVSRSIEKAQERIEGHHFDSRKYVLEYDDVMNKHRMAMYRLRSEVLRSDDNRSRMLEWLEELIDQQVAMHRDAITGQVNAGEVAGALKTLAPFETDLHSKLVELTPSSPSEGTEKMSDYLNDELERLYEAKEEQQEGDDMRHLEKTVMLRSIDDVWVEHLEAMDSLRESVQLRAYGQRDPLVEYKIEAQKMFGRLLETVRMRGASVIFHAHRMSAAQHKNVQERRPETAAGEQTPPHNHDVQPQHGGEPISSGPKIGRNDPCFCGSGKKYKKCGLLETDEHKANMAKK